MLWNGVFWMTVRGEVSVDFFQTVVSRTLDGVIVGAPDGRILYANPAACDMFGASEADLRRLGREGITDPRHPALRAMLDERDRTGQTRGVGPMRRLDGTPFLAEVASTMVEMPDGERRSCVILRDVTERVHLERNRAALNDVVQALLAGADPAQVLTVVARHAQIIFDATDSAVVTPAEPPDDVVLTAAEGPRMSQLRGRRFPAGTVARRVMDSGSALLIEDLSSSAISEEGRQLGLGPAMAAPIVSGQEVYGIVFVGGDTSRHPYTSEDLAVITTFAERAGLALAIGEARSQSERQQRRHSEQLQTALDSRIIVEQAKGLIAGARRIDLDEAFERLRTYARNHSQNIHITSQAVIDRKLLP
jgi:PAS domain S-box-containing protein